MRKALALLLAALALLCLVAPAQAQDLEKDLREVRTRIDDLADNVDAMAVRRSALARDVVSTRDTLDALVADLGVVRADYDVVLGDVRHKQIQLQGLRNQIRDLKAALAETRAGIEIHTFQARDLVRDRYMAAGASETALALVVSDMEEVTIGVEYLERVSADNEHVMVELAALEQQEERQSVLVAGRERAATEEAAQLAVLEDQLATQYEELAEKEEAVEAELVHQQRLLNDVDAEIAEIEGEIAALEKEQGQITAAIEQRSSKPGDGEDPKIGSGGWFRPVPGAIGSGFGWRTHPILGYRRMHTGVDMRAGHGDAIVAATAGVVILAGWHGGYGNCVVIDHGGGVTTLYAHQSQINVSVGQSVAGGKVVGYVGSTGMSTGPHLHFEVRLSGKPVNPVPYL